MLALLTAQGADPPAALAVAYRSHLLRCRPDAATLDQIAKDVRRTHSSFAHFAQRGPAHDRLLNVLVCAAELDGVGYVQGLNFIAAALLYHCEEHYAFFALRRLFAAVDARGLYGDSLEGVLAEVERFFEESLAGACPEAFRDLQAKDLPPTALFTEWFVTLGTSVVPLKHHLPLLRGVLASGREFLHRALAAAVAAVLADFRAADAAGTALVLKQLGRRVRWRELL